MLNIVFMGTPDFAKESLESIYSVGHNIIGVVTNPDRPKGRGMKMIFSPVKEYALEKGLKVLQPEKISSIIEEIRSLKPDVIVVVAYGKIIPKEILEIPKLGSINVHGSLLPKYRGAAPIQWAVLNGDKQTGITTMYMDEGMDTGDIILQETLDIGEYETTGEVWNRMSTLGAKLLVETLKQIEQNIAPRIKQGPDFTMAPMLNKEMAKIDWEALNTEKIKDLVRGLNPFMGAYTTYNGKKLKIWKVRVIKESINNGKNGTIIKADTSSGLYVKAKDGIISVEELQAENSKRLSIYDFLRGNQILEGEMFI